MSSALLESKQILSHIEQSSAILWNKVFDRASITGDLDTLKLLCIQNQLTSLQADCFALACEYGHRHIINFFLDHLKGFQFDRQSYTYLTQTYYQRGLFSASKGGHLDIVQMILEKYQPSPHEVDCAFKVACLKCSWEIIFFLHKKFNITHVNGLREACEGRHRKLVDWLIEHGDHYWDAGLAGACLSGDVSLIQLMIECGARNTDHGFQSTCEMGHVDASKYFLESGYSSIARIYLGYVRTVAMKKLLIEYDKARVLSFSSSDICALLNKGVSLQTLLLYNNSDIITRTVGLANHLLQVVQFSLRNLLCTDLVDVLKSFIGYDVNRQMMESIKWYYG